MSASTSHLLRGFQLVWIREWLIARSSKVDWLNAVIFFVMSLSIMPMTLDVQATNLALITPSLIWVVALLAIMLSSDLWFKLDYEQGYLHQWFTSPYPVFLLVLAKVISHWLFVGGGVVLATPLIAIMMGLSFEVSMMTLLTLLLGTLSISFVCALSAALTLGLRQAGMLLVVLSMPLNVPVIVFGAGTVTHFIQSASFSGGLFLLAAFAFATLTFMPFAIAAALRISLE